MHFIHAPLLVQIIFDETFIRNVDHNIIQMIEAKKSAKLGCVLVGGRTQIRTDK